jgi:hypothetical protein
MHCACHVSNRRTVSRLSGWLWIRHEFTVHRNQVRSISGRAHGRADGRVEGDVPSLAESFNEVMAVEGVRVAALVDIATGMIVRSAGEPAGDFPAAAASMAGEARAARTVLGPGRTSGGDLDEIALVTGGRLQLSTVLSPRFGEGLLLFVELDRARVNMALASLQIGRLAAGILA